jgi:rubrerythrin
VTRCLYCHEPLIFRQGWRHAGGGLYVMRCGRCGYSHDGPTTVTCPRCGARREWRDDHAALPDQGGAE